MTKRKRKKPPEACDCATCSGSISPETALAITMQAFVETARFLSALIPDCESSEEAPDTLAFLKKASEVVSLYEETKARRNRQRIDA